MDNPNDLVRQVIQQLHDSTGDVQIPELQRRLSRFHIQMDETSLETRIREYLRFKDLVEGSTSDPKTGPNLAD